MKANRKSNKNAGKPPARSVPGKDITDGTNVYGTAAASKAKGGSTLRTKARSLCERMDAVSLISLTLIVTGIVLIAGGLLVWHGGATVPVLAIASWIFGSILVFGGLVVWLVSLWMAWTARRFPGFPPALTLIPFQIAGIAATVGFLMLIRRLAP